MLGIILLFDTCSSFGLVAQELAKEDDRDFFPKAHYAVHLNKQPARVMTAVELAGRLYVEPIVLAMALDCELRSEGALAVLLTPSHVLAFAIDAHCVAVQAANSDSVSLTQMLHPVALHFGHMLLPLDDVLRLLVDNGVYEVDERDAEIFIKSFDDEGVFPERQEEQTTTIARKPLPDAIEMGFPPREKPSLEPRTNTPQQENLKSERSVMPQQDAAKQFRKPTRNLYILPNDVKRRELDELPQKTSLRSESQGSLFTRYSTQILVWGVVEKVIKKKFLSVEDEKKKTILSQTASASSTEKSSQTKKEAASPAKKSDEKSTEPQGENDFSSAKKKWALDVIVLDAGHGGKDAGAIGVGKTKEKDVTLGIVKKLGAQIKKALPGTKIVYTRTDDTFVELDRRGQIANENGGKLFISIHCNSTPKKPSTANGFEVYILRPGRNEDAVRVAEMENAVIKLEDNPKRYKPLTDEQFIVVSMAQSAFVKYSDMAAAMISAEVKKLKEIGVRGVNQAGFLVLVGASMPNMLIETGFLSNKKDEKFLKSERGQNQIASAICRAIKAYRVRYESQIKGQASLGSSGSSGASTKSEPLGKNLSQKAASTNVRSKPISKTATKSSAKPSSKVNSK